MHSRVRLALLCAALLASAACGRSDTTPRIPVELVVPALDGGDIRTSQYHGRIVVVHLFATWSMAAMVDTSQLTALHQQRGGDVVVLGVAVDRDGYRMVAPWRKSLELPYMIGLASEALVAGNTQLGPIKRVPMTVILDRRGAIAQRIERPLRPDELSTAVARIADRR